MRLICINAKRTKHLELFEHYNCKPHGRFVNANGRVYLGKRFDTEVFKPTPKHVIQGVEEGMEYESEVDEDKHEGMRLLQGNDGEQVIHRPQLFSGLRQLLERFTSKSN